MLFLCGKDGFPACALMREKKNRLLGKDGSKATASNPSLCLVVADKPNNQNCVILDANCGL